MNTFVISDAHLRNSIGADYESDVALRAFAGFVPRAFFFFLSSVNFLSASRLSIKYRDVVFR